MCVVLCMCGFVYDVLMCVMYCVGVSVLCMFLCTYLRIYQRTHAYLHRHPPTYSPLDKNKEGWSSTDYKVYEFKCTVLSLTLPAHTLYFSSTSPALSIYNPTTSSPPTNCNPASPSCAEHLSLATQAFEEPPLRSSISLVFDEMDDERWMLGRS